MVVARSSYPTTKIPSEAVQTGFFRVCQGLPAQSMCGRAFSPMIFYVILSVPLHGGKGAVCIDGGLAPSGKRPGDVKSLLFLVPPDANAKGGMHHGVK